MAADKSDSNPKEKPGTPSSDGSIAPEETGVPTKNIRILVVLNQKRSMQGALAFLQRRGYVVVIVSNIVEGFKKLQGLKPHAVLISWNLKNTDVRKAYKLLHDKFKTTCIVFAEDNATRTAAALMSSGIPNTLLAPVSGPGIHMRIQSLLRAKHTAENKVRDDALHSDHRQDQKRSRASARAAASMIATIASDPVEIRSGDVPPDTAWEKTIEAAPGGDGNHLFKGSVVNKSGTKSVFYFKGPQTPFFDPMKQKWDGFETGGPIMRQEMAVPKEYSVQQSGPEEKDYSAIQEGMEGSSFEANAGGAPLSDSEFQRNPVLTGPGVNLESEFSDLEKELMGAFNETPVFTTDEAVNLEVSADDLKELTKESSDADDVGEPELENSSDDAAAEAELTAAAAAFTAGSTSSRSTVDPRLAQFKVNKDKQNILAQSVLQAMEACSVPSPHAALDFSTFEKAIGITIETSRFKGYLILVSSNDIPSLELMQAMLTRIEGRMKDYGEPLNIYKMMEIDFDPVDFDPWVEAETEFSIVGQHGTDRIAVCFLSVTKLPRIADSGESPVSAIDLETQLFPESKILFDLYLYMPKNGKHILYLKENSYLSANTYEKLRKFGVTTVYIRNDQKLMFSAYCARLRILQGLKKLKAA